MRLFRHAGTGADVSGRRRLKIDLAWWLPMVIAAVYVLFVVANLGQILGHTWWSGDSAEAGVIGQLYHRPPAGQYVIIGDHGWFEALLFYVATRVLPAHRVLWIAAPVGFWIVTVVLIGVGATVAFGRWAGGLVIAALLLVAPAGLMVIFQPTAHTNDVLHAAFLALVSALVLPRITEIRLRRLAVLAVVVGLFSGLPVHGDALALAWEVVPFLVVIVLYAWRGPSEALARTAGFGLVTLLAIEAGAKAMGATISALGFRIDAQAQAYALRFTTPAVIGRTLQALLADFTYLVGGQFFGQPLSGMAVIDLVSAVLLAAAVVAVAFSVRDAVASAGPRRPVRTEPLAASFIYTAFWSTAVVVGVSVYLLGTPGAGDSRYLVGPLVGIAALLPVAARRSLGWRLLVSAGVCVFALVGVIRMVKLPRMPMLRETIPVTSRTVNEVSEFVARWHARIGFAEYRDAMTFTWKSDFRIDLSVIRPCDQPAAHRYCFRYQVAFTQDYIPRAHVRSLFIGDPVTGVRIPDPGWGKPLAAKHIGRLRVYVYPYDIAARILHQTPASIHAIITG
ncbi:MAG: hypothetical protein ACP5H2_12155 [Solirubrobacteraceae bacterium]